MPLPAARVSPDRPQCLGQQAHTRNDAASCHALHLRCAGTPLGDPIEVGALGDGLAAEGAHGQRARHCLTLGVLLI